MQRPCWLGGARRAFADSKTLTEEKRERLFEQIQQDHSLGYLADALSAQFISAKMLSREKVRGLGTTGAVGD